MWKQLTFCIHGIRPWKGYKCGYAFKRGWELTPIVSYGETLSNFLLINSPPLTLKALGLEHARQGLYHWAISPRCLLDLAEAQGGYSSCVCSLSRNTWLSVNCYVWRMYLGSTEKNSGCRRNTRQRHILTWSTSDSFGVTISKLT